jgi:hypothetical protein
MCGYQTLIYELMIGKKKKGKKGPDPEELEQQKDHRVTMGHL